MEISQVIQAINNIKVLMEKISRKYTKNGPSHCLLLALPTSLLCNHKISIKQGTSLVVALEVVKLLEETPR